VFQRVLKVPAGHAGVLASEHFGAHAFFTGDRFHDSDVLVGRDEENIVQVGGDVLALQKRAGGGEGKGTGLLNGAAKHSTVRELDEVVVKLGVEIDITVERFDG